MRMIAAALAAIFITLSAMPCQAYDGMEPTHEAECATDKEMHDALFKQGFVVFQYMTAEQGFMIVIFMGADGYIMTAEVEGVSCILTSGGEIYGERERGI